ncbi:hydantoinase B/oxoprolinase family protein [Xanthobacter autotrophicus DSM 431]|uniref:hydantoinase B/oxoprolinase family protein n=1 Tax=Xanthobacter nonsaccharivorans TaxID=3119912 RepID=UPI00372BA67F
MANLSIDPATLTVMENALRQIVDEMDVALERAAFNPVMSQARDRANGIYHKATGEVVAQGDTGLPIFVGVMQYAVQSALEAFPDLEEGDVVILNDPYCGGTHLMDVKLVRPFFYKGQRFAFLANCGHWTDIGGNVPGGFGVRATEIIQEGVRIPPILLARKGVMREEILTLLFANMRVPEERRGDLQAQIAALNVGAARLTNLLDKYGDSNVERYIDELRERSERQMRSYIKAMPDGTYVAEAFLDSDGIDPAPIRVALSMTVRDDTLAFDFTGSSAPVKGPLNGTLSVTFAAVFVALKHIFPEVPINAGIFRPVTIKVPEDTFLNAKYPRAVSGSSAEVSLRVVDAVFGCLGQAVPERVPASSFGSVANFTISGYDPEQRKPYIMFRFSGGGYGGHAGGDGLTNANSPIGASRTTPIEILEQQYPIMFDYYRIREGSAGPGERRGGFGSEWQIRLVRGDAVSSVLGDRGRFPPAGLHGGGEALPTVVEYHRAGTPYRPEHLTKDEGIVLHPGDTARVAMPGGGGLGDPRRRDPRKVLTDVLHGLITAEDASAQYGVVLTSGHGGWLIDDVATREARAAALP